MYPDSGLYAKEGESTCTHSCADALFEDPSAILACMTPSQANTAKAANAGLSYNNILINATQLTSDWFGVPIVPIQPANWNSIPMLGSTVVYHAGSIPGHAPGKNCFPKTYTTLHNTTKTYIPFKPHLLLLLFFLSFFSCVLGREERVGV